MINKTINLQSWFSVLYNFKLVKLNGRRAASCPIGHAVSKIGHAVSKNGHAVSKKKFFLRRSTRKTSRAFFLSKNFFLALGHLLKNGCFGHAVSKMTLDTKPPADEIKWSAYSFSTVPVTFSRSCSYCYYRL